MMLSAGYPVEDALALATVSAIRGTAAYLGEGKNVAIASVSAQLAAQTAQDGSFAFLGLAAGDYTVYLPLPVGATLAEGSAWRVTDQGDMLWLTVSVAAGESFALPAAEVKLATGVSGVAYMDDNGSGGYDEGEQLMSGVPVALASEGTGGWSVVDETTTDAYGAYSFTGLDAGTYRVLAQGADDLSVSSVGGSLSATDTVGVAAGAAFVLASGDQLSGVADIALAKARPSTWRRFSTATRTARAVFTSATLPA
jgi:hypothetical protein